MSQPSSLKDVYLDEMKDLWSANDQMTKALQQIGAQASDPKLKEMLEGSASGIEKHTDTLKSIITENGGEPEPEHCKGMQGLVTEALKHAVKEAPKNGTLRDVQIISQYQRMSHYGLAGFGSAAAYAKALGLTDQEKKLKRVIGDIYKADEYASHLAKTVEKAAV